MFEIQPSGRDGWMVVVLDPGNTIEACKTCTALTPCMVYGIFHKINWINDVFWNLFSTWNRISGKSNLESCSRNVFGCKQIHSQFRLHFCTHTHTRTGNVQWVHNSLVHRVYGWILIKFRIHVEMNVDDYESDRIFSWIKCWKQTNDMFNIYIWINVYETWMKTIAMAEIAISSNEQIHLFVRIKNGNFSENVGVSEMFYTFSTQQF